MESTCISSARSSAVLHVFSRPTTLSAATTGKYCSAAKRTSELIPLCHPLPLSVVDVSLEVGVEGVEIVAAAETTARTGVEMEALVAASVAALTVYDMAKAIDKDMVVSEVALVEQTKTPAA